MGIISRLKRAGYFGVTAALVVTAMPVVPFLEGLAYADATITEVDTCDALTAALTDDNGAIKLTTNLTGCATMELTQAKTIDGDGHSITFSGNGANVKTNEAVEFDNVTISASGVGINIPQGFDATATNITLNGATINATERGVSYLQAQEHANLTINNSVIQNSAVTNYDSDWKTGYTRGINFVDFLNSTANITNTTVQGFQYDVNMTAHSMAGSTLNFSGMTLKGWTGFNMWQTSATVNVSNSEIYGINKFNGAGGNSFSDVILNGNWDSTIHDYTPVAMYNSLTFNNVGFNSVYVGDALDDAATASQWMLSDFGSNNTIVMNNCDFTTNLPERTPYAITESGNANITIDSGTYDLPMESGYLAEGKVNYLVDGRYVVDDAPELDEVPAQIIVKAGEETTIPGLEDVSEYANFEAHRGDTQMDGNPRFVSPGVLTTPSAGYGAANVTFNIYTYDDNTGEIVRDNSYDKKILFHSYEASEADDVYLEVDGEQDLDLEFTTDQKSTGEVYMEDESVATIEEGDNGAYTVRAVSEGETKIYGRITVNNDQTIIEDEIELGTVKVYSFEAEGEIRIPVGTELELSDDIITRIGNPSVVEARIANGSGYVSLDGETVEDGVLTATNRGTATVEYYVNGAKVWQTRVRVYALQNPSDILLRIGQSDNNANLHSSTTFSLGQHTNLPSYGLSAEDDVVSISNRYGSLRITARRAGESKVTVTYNDSLDGATTEEFTVRVSDFNSDAEDSYDVVAGDEIEFTMSEEYGQNSVTCKIDDEDCFDNDNEDFEIERDDEGNYTVSVADDAEGGEYTLSFVDKINGTTIATREVTIRVHEVTVSEDELYVLAGEDAAITVSSNFGGICESHQHTRWEWQGWRLVRVTYYTYDCDVTVAPADASLSEDGVSVECTEGEGADECTITANEAGEYVVTFSDGVAEKSVTVYVIDFSVEDAEYHVVKGDTALHLVNAINEYWSETWKGSTTGFKVLADEGTKYYFQLDGAEAGEYTIDFYAYAGPNRFDKANRAVQDTKSIKVYVYEMVAPEQTKYYGEMKSGRNEFDVVVADEINGVVEGMAEIGYEVTEGDANEITVDVENGKVTVNKAGKYTVKYTDTMNRGEGDLAGEYTATFEVFGLDADTPKGQFIDLGGVYTYTIDPAETYGDVEVVITYTDVDGNEEEISRETIAYPNDGEEEIEFVPEEEGKYTVRIENISAKEHGFREVEKGEFYVIAREYSFGLVRSGTVVEIASNSAWSVDSARDSHNPEPLIVEDGVVTLDTSDMRLGVRTVTLYHKFGKGQKEVLKRVTLAIYDVAPESTDENNTVINETLDDLFSKVEELTNDPEAMQDLQQQIMEAMIEAITSGEEVDIETIIKDVLSQNPALGKAQEMFGPEWQATIMNLNEAVEYGDVIRTRVNVKEAEPEDNVKAAILEALSAYGISDAEYYDVTVEMYVTFEGDEGEEEYTLGLIHKLDGKITVALAEATDPETGYTRTYYVVRVHDGEEPEVLVEGVDFYIEDGVIYVTSDRFSTYAVAYKDTLTPVSPNTGVVAAEGASATASMLTSVVVMAAILTLAGATKFAVSRRK